MFSRNIQSHFLYATFGIFLGLMHGMPESVHAQEASSRPNVLLISIDDLNDWTSCLGGHPQAKTPHIDRLASWGTLFANAHCQAPVCNPSRASMMTGRYPHHTGIYFLSPDLKKSPVAAELPTLPEYFAENGYKTMGIGKLFHGGDDRFFQEYGGRKNIVGPRPKAKISQPHGHPLWDWGAFPDSDEVIPDYKYAQWTAKKLKEEHDKPFFLAVGFFRPHVPMYAPKKWFDLHPRNDVELPKIKYGDISDLSPYAIKLTTLEHVSPKHEWVKSSGEWDHAVQAYLACVSFADQCVGMVLDALETSRYAENTIVVLFSDHGFHLGEKNHWAKRTLWEDGTRVPLIVAAPGHTKNQTCSRPAELIDVYPTLIDLAGLPVDKTQEGQSLQPLMKDVDREWDHPALTSFGPDNYSVRSTRYRYIQYLDGSKELYDHEQDPHEWNNLAQDKTLEAVIAEHAKHVPTTQSLVLQGNSTGHKAYAAANAKVKNRRGLKPLAPSAP